MAVYISPNRITCIPGFADTTSCKIGIYTFFDPTSDLVYLTINNTTYVSGTDFTLTQRGTDGTPDQACWSGSYTVSNLVGHSEYTWRVSQTVSSVQYKDSGSFRTAPGADDDFSFFFVSCDNNTGPASVTTKDPTGAWGSIREYAQSGTLPVAGIFYVDDYGYVDRAIFNDGDGTGLVNSLSPTFLLTEFSYTAGWMLMFGMLGNNDDDSIELLFGREENRAWCRKNLNLWMQWGDHELNNDIGWDDTTTFTDDPNVTPIHSTYIATVGQYDGPGIVSFENMIGLTRPDLSRNLDTIAQHWVAQVGCITLVAPDFISRCEGYTLTSAQKHSVDVLPSFQILGNNQIDDILSAVAGTTGIFTIFGNSYSLMAPVDTYVGGLSEGSSGGQHFLYDYNNTEWARLFDSGLLANSTTNGAYGSLVHLHGDYHNPHVYKHTVAVDKMYEIGVGTINGSAHFTYDGVSAGDTLGNTEIEYIASGSSDWGSSTSYDEKYHSLRVDVYGSKSPKELHIILKNTNGDEVWYKKFIQYRGNFAYDKDTVPVYIGTSSSGINE